MKRNGMVASAVLVGVALAAAGWLLVDGRETGSRRPWSGAFVNTAVVEPVSAAVATGSAQGVGVVPLAAPAPATRDADAAVPPEPAASRSAVFLVDGRTPAQLLAPYAQAPLLHGRRNLAVDDQLYLLARQVIGEYEPDSIPKAIERNLDRFERDYVAVLGTPEERRARWPDLPDWAAIRPVVQQGIETMALVHRHHLGICEVLGDDDQLHMLSPHERADYIGLRDASWALRAAIDDAISRHLDPFGIAARSIHRHSRD